MAMLSTAKKTLIQILGWMKYPQKHVQVFFGSTTPKMSDMTGFMKEFDIDSGFLFQKLDICLEAYFTLHLKTERFPPGVFNLQCQSY